MNMSRSIRRALLARALAVSVVDLCRASESVAGSPAAGLVVDRLARLCDAVLGRISGGKPTLEFDRKSERAFLASLADVKNSLLATLPDGEVDARAWTTAVLLWVEDHRDSIPPHPPERRHEWFKIAENLQALSEILDPERLDAPVEAGMGYGEAMKQAAGVW
jgi:hypothetical protein